MNLTHYSREAVRGLVWGLTHDIEYARHRSLGHGDLECFDVLYTLPYVDRKWGIVPAYISNALSPYIKILEDAGIGLSFSGYSEGVLFFRLEGREIPVHGEKREMIVLQLGQEVRKRLSDIQLVDVTPSTILEGTESRFS